MWIIFFKKNTIYVIFLSKYGMIKRRKKGDFVEKAIQLWNLTKNELKNSNTVSLADFEAVIEPIVSVHKVLNNYIYLIVENGLAKYRFEKFYLDSANEALKKFTSEPTKFKAIILEDAKKEDAEKAKKEFNKPDESELTRNNRKLRVEYTFENFVTGESNRFAFITASKVAESPHVTLNPLYIFGDVGLGKTHLMMAIGHYILDRDINSNVIYTTAQQFADDYYLATRKKDGTGLDQFYSYYRSADVLLVDDIQFLAKKEGTQEEFFKLFEYLFENNKQIIITSDRKASDLENIMSRLKSRFAWGGLIDIKKPDPDHRKNILKHKLNQLINNPSDIPDEVLNYIANNFSTNIRDLEGALRRFINFCVAFNYPYTLENAKNALDVLLENSSEAIEDDNEQGIKTIKEAVAKYYNITLSDLCSATRKKEIVLARQIAIYLVHTLYSPTYKTIATHFGYKDHTTVMYTLDKIKALVENDWTYKQAIANISKDLESK